MGSKHLCSSFTSWTVCPCLVDEKLKWMFKLYDKDGNGEIDMEEMEDIFTKLCIVNLLFIFS